MHGSECLTCSWDFWGPAFIVFAFASGAIFIMTRAIILDNRDRRFFWKNSFKALMDNPREFQRFKRRVAEPGPLSYGDKQLVKLLLRKNTNEER